MGRGRYTFKKLPIDYTGPFMLLCASYLWLQIQEIRCLEETGWSFGWLKRIYTVLGKIQPLKRMLTLLDFGSFLKEIQNCRHIIGTPRRNIFHAAKSSQMPYSAPQRNINLANEIKNPLELRLGIIRSRACTPKLIIAETPRTHTRRH